MIIDKKILIIFIVYCLYKKYRQLPFLLNYFLYVHHISCNFFNYFNKFIYPEYWDEKSNENDEKKSDNINITEEKPPKKYEDKYLDDIRNLNKEWEFTEEEQNEVPKLIVNFFISSKQSMFNEMEQLLVEISNLEKDIREDVDTENYVEDFDTNDDDNDDYNGPTLEERNKERTNQIEIFKCEYEKINLDINTEEGLERLKLKSEQRAIQSIINKRLDKLSNCFVMEKTPIGNVLMIYDKEMSKFKYYSDASMPYRYLEVVGRKYVKLFNCRPIFVDMEEELRLFEEKWEKEQEMKKKREEEEKLKAEEAAKSQQVSEIKKKNVFAKFKSYNKDAGGKISMAPPPKNNIPTKSVTENKENEKILLKERANCYTYDGKLSNFNFLKKVEKKVFNKKLGISFADFKKINK